MKGYKKVRLLLPLLTIFIQTILSVPAASAGTFGAEIFCTMRDGGNDHESSWEAAYTYIKKQKGGIFKVSPKQAASQITETVIRESEKFSFCVEYLDNLHPNRKQKKELKKEEKDKNERKALEETLEDSNKEFSEEFSEELTEETFERYSY